MIPERMFALFAVWSLFLSSVTQAIIHLTTWWILRRQRNEARLGVELTRGEFWLGVKSSVRAVFDLLLAVIVTWDIYIFNGTERIALYVAVGLVTYITTYHRLRFLSEIRRESWGGNEDVNERQDIREKEQNERETFQGEQAIRIARRQIAREDTLDAREGIADTRQEIADTREAVADTREAVADVRQAAQDTRDTDREESP